MIEEQEYDRELLGEACVYDDIYKQPARKTCVTLFARGMEKVIEKEKEAFGSTFYYIIKFIPHIKRDCVIYRVSVRWSAKYRKFSACFVLKT